jgi:hypothetical protein
MKDMYSNPSINKFPWSCAVFIKLGNKLERKFEQSDNKGLINLISLSEMLFH